MKIFKTKKEVFEYIKENYKDAEAILIKGSTAQGKIKEFSDIDVEFYQDKSAKPEYELVLVEDKLVLISAYPYKMGKGIEKIPDNVLVLKGDYCEQIDIQKKYTEEERAVRDNQMFLDFLFKYLRTRDKKYLEIVKKYLKLK